MILTRLRARPRLREWPKLRAWPDLRAWIGASLQRRFIATLAAVLVATSALFLLLIADLYRARITDEHARASLQINALLQAALENAMLKRDLPGLHGILDDLGRQPDIAAVRILNPDLDVRFASDRALERTSLDTTETRAALADRQPRTLLVADATDGPVLRSINPVHNQPACQVCHGQVAEHPVNGLLVVDYSAQGITTDTRRGVLFLALSGLAVILALSLAAWGVLARTVLAPLTLLGAGTEALAKGDLSHRIPVTGTDEPARLATGFNAMADLLQSSVARLHSSERTLQAVIDAIPDGIRVIGPDYRILMANAAYAAHVGKPLAEVVGALCHTSSHGRDRPCPDTLTCCPLAEMRLARAPLTCRQIHLRLAGEDIHVEVAAAPVTLMHDGQAVDCVVEAIRDLEQQARLTQEHRLSELGLLAAGMAHEIFNPLSSVVLLVSALQADTAAGRHEATPVRLATLHDEIARTLAITDSLLLLCAPPSPEPLLIDLDRVIPEALALLSFQARSTGAVIRCDIDRGLRMLGSDGDIRMLITNLVLNALHAMPKGGTVTVTGRASGGEVILCVEDTGHGIAPRDLDRIFLPFWTRRADGSSGCGLGLSIAQAVVDRAHGRIAVESTVGVGTPFTIRFPDPDHPPAGASA